MFIVPMPSYTLYSMIGRLGGLKFDGPNLYYELLNDVTSLARLFITEHTNIQDICELQNRKYKEYLKTLRQL
jgi:hypothetical protein